jgi:hypothetical protein
MKWVRLLGMGYMVAMTAACAPSHGKYAWGEYESSLYDHYKTPDADNTVFTRRLSDAISDAEVSGKRVPPGLYAEYGHLLLESGKSQQATEYFAKEKKNWPESTVLMDTLIRLNEKSKDET